MVITIINIRKIDIIISTLNNAKSKSFYNSIFFGRKSIPSGRREEQVSVRTVVIHIQMLGNQSIARNVPMKLEAHMYPSLKSKNYMYHLRSVLLLWTRKI